MVLEIAASTIDLSWRGRRDAASVGKTTSSGTGSGNKAGQSEVLDSTSSGLQERGKEDMQMHRDQRGYHDSFRSACSEADAYQVVEEERRSWRGILPISAAGFRAESPKIM